LKNLLAPPKTRESGFLHLCVWILVLRLWVSMLFLP
jgi:hypothetical protein